MLRFSHEISGASDFKVPHGDLESRTKLCEVLQCTKPLFSHFSEHLVLLVGQIRIGDSVGSSHSAPQLIEL